MLAISVLLALGEPMDEAESAVSRAGSLVETMPQIEMLSWCAAKINRSEPFDVQRYNVRRSNVLSFNRYALFKTFKSEDGGPGFAWIPDRSIRE